MEKYYSLKGIKKLNCEYNILLGERANGKSYSVKDEVLKNAWQNKEEFIYLRRWKEDIRRVSIVNYFADMDIKNIQGVVMIRLKFTKVKYSFPLYNQTEKRKEACELVMQYH